MMPKVTYDERDPRSRPTYRLRRVYMLAVVDHSPKFNRPEYVSLDLEEGTLDDYEDYLLDKYGSYQMYIIETADSSDT